MTAVQWKTRVLILLGFTAVSLVALLFVPPIPQDQAYHHYADQRAVLGIPNFWNVVSNIPFLLVGSAGLRLAGPLSMRIMFLGIFFVGFGSAYYHWNPNDATLIWDRLPMTVGFMAILSIIIEERVSEKAGALLLWPLLALGVVSLLVWRFTGDLRLYGWVQFFPVIALLFIFVLFPPKFTGTANWLIAAALYALAKLPEFYDTTIFSAAHDVVSGHTIKHLVAAAGCFFILRNFQTRHALSASIRS